MKTNNLKYIAYALAALMLMQSCVVYHKAPVSVDEAVTRKDKVKIYTTENKRYTFDKLVKEKSNIYGIKSLSKLNKEVFASFVKEIDQDNNLAKILLPFDIKEIYTKNKSASTVVTLIVALSPIWIPGIAIGIFVATY